MSDFCLRMLRNRCCLRRALCRTRLLTLNLLSLLHSSQGVRFAHLSRLQTAMVLCHILLLVLLVKSTPKICRARPSLSSFCANFGTFLQSAGASWVDDDLDDLLKWAMSGELSNLTESSLDCGGAKIIKTRLIFSMFVLLPERRQDGRPPIAQGKSSRYSFAMVRIFARTGGGAVAEGCQTTSAEWCLGWQERNTKFIAVAVMVVLLGICNFTPISSYAAHERQPLFMSAGLPF